MKKNDHRVVVIGLDGGTFDLILPLIEKGELPHMARFIKEGPWGELTSTIPSITMPAWPSLLTGVNPAKHGLFFFKGNTHSTYDEGDLLGSSDYKARCLWDILNEHKKRVIFTGVPTTYPPPPVKGIMLSAIKPLQQEQFKVHPPELEQEIKTVLGLTHRIEKFSSTYRDAEKEHFFERIRSFHTNAVDKLTGLNLHLIKKYNWSFMMTVYLSVDVVQHFCWSLMDPTHPSHDQSLARRFGDIIPEVYKKIDAGIGRIVEAAGQDATIILVSDHGAGPVHKKFEINRWLLKEGFLFLKQPRPYNWRLKKKPLHLVWQRFGLNKIFRSIPEILTRYELPWFQKEQLPVYKAVDWKRTVAYATHTGININLKGREPQGIVEKEDYASLIGKLKKRLIDAVGVDSDKKIVEHVFSRDEIYAGPWLDEAGDLYIAADNIFAFGKALTRGAVIENLTVSSPSGGHLNKRNGIFMMKSPHANSGIELKKLQIVDVMPMILHLLGIKIPEYLDGKVFTAALKSEYLDLHPVQFDQGKMDPDTASATSLTTEEQRALKTQLTSLGYL